MKNKILYLFMLVLATGFYSCDKDTTGGVTLMTYYPSIEMQGDNPVAVAIGSNYQDAGVYSELFGVDVTDKVEVASNVSTDAGGVYQVSYTVTSTDGYQRTETRTVIVCDINYNHDDLSGPYTGSVKRTTLSNGGTRSYSGNPVTLTKTSLGYGIYEISDWIAGFYAVGAAYNYGPNYAFSGLMQVTGENKIVLISMKNPWGSPFTQMSGAYDATTGDISWTTNWNNNAYKFEVVITKN